MEGPSARSGLAAALLLVALASPGAAQVGDAVGAAATEDPVVLSPAAGRIEVDGRLEEAAWERAVAVRLPWEVAPGDNEPAPVATECRLTFDEERLLVGCRASDPRPDRIRAYLTDRDGIDAHDRIVLALDTFDDARRAFEFGASALGVQQDGLYEEATGDRDLTWDAIWTSAGRTTRDGYELEIAIPFRSLRFPGGREVQTWGFYLRRHWPRTDDVETRTTPWNRGQACMLCGAPHLTGITGVSPGVNLELVPTVTATRTDRPTGGDDAGLAAGDLEGELGFDARWSPTAELALNATVNPDFSQVEADAPQLEVNRRFTLAFPEKRPFFLEGADLFATPIRAVFTRSVADPSFGAKLTGKLGGDAVGLMAVRDEVNNLLLPGNQGSSLTSIDRPVTGLFGRVRRDVGASGTVGGLYTGRASRDYQNHVFGADAVLQPLSALTLRVQALHSVTDDPPEVSGAGGDGSAAGAYGGDAGWVSARYRTRNWHAELDALGFSPQFRADAGFVPQVDLLEVNLSAGRLFWGGEGAPFTSIDLVGGGWYSTSWAGRLTYRALYLNAAYTGPWQSSLWVNPTLQQEWFAGEVHTLDRFWFGGSVRPTGTIGLDYTGFFGEAIDFANARTAGQVRVQPAARLRLGRHLDLRASWQWQRLTHEGHEVFTASVGEGRAVYSFSPEAFVRATVQHRRTTRNPDSHADPVRISETGLSAQLLLAYRVTPLTSLYLGYGDDREGHVAADRTRTSLEPTRRTFFLKLGYGWRP